MQFASTHDIIIFKKEKIKFLNTLFALSIAFYYSFIDFFPKTVCWVAHLDFYEINTFSAGNKPLAEFFSSPNLSNTSPFLPSDALRRVSQKHSRSYPGNEKTIVHSLSPVSHSPKSPDIEALHQNPLDFVKRPEDVRLQTTPLPKAPSFILKSEAAPLPRVFSSVLKPLTQQTPDELDTTGATALPTTTTVRAVTAPCIGETATQSLSHLASCSEPIPVEVPSPESVSSPSSKSLKPWNEYQELVSNDPFLKLWLMKLAPGVRTSIDEEEIPFRQALIETLLSPEFQPYITSTWEDDEEMRPRRIALHDAYMKKLYKGVYKNQVPLEWLLHTPDLHSNKGAAYWYAYDFPEGVRGTRGSLGKLYKDEDFPHDT